MPSQRRIRRAALTPPVARLYAGDAAAHEYHTGEPGSFDTLVARLEAERGAAVTTPITRSNYRVLGAIPTLLSRCRVAGWRVVVERGGALDAARPAPRLALAIPFALHALDRAQKLGVDAAIVDAPLCLLGPFAARAERSETPGAFPPRCDDCAVCARCPGVDPAYAARFGDEELVPQRG